MTGTGNQPPHSLGDELMTQGLSSAPCTNTSIKFVPRESAVGLPLKLPVEFTEVQARHVPDAARHALVRLL
jgi:hypothetical protein